MKSFFTALPGRRRTAAAPATEDGERVYAIGDVHGRLDLLRQLLECIDAHENTLPATGTTSIVLLGDLIDRGPHSFEVIEFVRQLQQSERNVIALLGNHEEVMLDTLDGETGALGAWLGFGGRETLASLGIAVSDDGFDARDLVSRMRERIPDEVVEWLKTLPLSVRSGDYFFCHAGIRPGVPLRRQRREDLLWIRDAFLQSDADHEVVVIHGHSIAYTVEQLPNRIGIDTGAYANGRLTALYLERTARDILTVTG